MLETSKTVVAIPVGVWPAAAQRLMRRSAALMGEPMAIGVRRNVCRWPWLGQGRVPLCLRLVERLGIALEMGPGAKMAIDPNAGLVMARCASLWITKYPKNAALRRTVVTPAFAHATAVGVRPPIVQSAGLALVRSASSQTTRSPLPIVRP